MRDDRQTNRKTSEAMQTAARTIAGGACIKDRVDRKLYLHGRARYVLSAL